MNSQIDMLIKNSTAQYQTIAASLSRDIAVLPERGMASILGAVDMDAVNVLVTGYARYYRQHNIRIELTDMTLFAQESESDGSRTALFVNEGQESFVHITGSLSDTFPNFRLDFYYDTSESISEVRAIQTNLLLICIAFSVITAFALHFIINLLFKPLAIVAKTSKEIANGNYSERIHIKGKSELSEMAGDFNKMADEIQRQIYILEDEAAGKQQFIDNFAHEMRTPLTSIYGFAEYIQKAPLDENEIAESTQYIMNEANHMKKVANSLLELATLRNYSPTVSEIPIPALFEDIKQTMSKPLLEKEIKLECEHDIDILKGQEDLIKSLILNLCYNSLKSCTPAEGIIRLEVKKHGNSTRLTLSDNGCGIPEESISRLTSPFYRVEKDRKREYGGAGLGLTLCKQIAEAHGAEMTIESKLGEGTTVKISFTTP